MNSASTIEAPDSILPHVAKHEQKAGQAQRAWDDVRTGGNKNIFKRIGNRVKASVKQRGADSAERQRNKASAEYDKLCDQAVPKLDQFKGSWMSVDSAIEGDAIIDTALESIRTAARRSIADPRFKELRDQHFFVGQDIQDFNSTAQEQEHKTVKRN